jgi:hypothetical protein
MVDYGLEEEGLEPRPGRRWQNPLTWSALAALGVLVYELTAQPGLGAAVLCLKFGLNDARTAWWLSRIDGNRRRGGVCFWLYLASALWKVAITGTALTFAFPLIESMFNPRAPGAPPPNGPRLPPALVAAMVTTFFGFFFSVLITIVALWGAWRHGIRIWLNSEIHGARRSNVWPSLYPWYGSSNKAGRLVLTALVSAYAVSAIAGIGLLANLKLDPRLSGVVITVFVVLLMIAGPVTILAVREFVIRRMLAVSPVQCWNRENWKRTDWLGVDDLATYDNRNPDL